MPNYIFWKSAFKHNYRTCALLFPHQVNIFINEDGTMNVFIMGYEFRSYFCIESYSYTCLWNVTDAPSKVFRQDNGGKLSTNVSQSVSDGFSLSYIIDARALQPPVDTGVWMGQIPDLRWNPKETQMVFNRKWTYFNTGKDDQMTVADVEMSTSSKDVTIHLYSYSRKTNNMTSSSTHQGNMPNVILKGSVRIFQLPYGE